MKKILVIDDTDFIREDIATTLQFEGYETITAEDGLAGLEKAKAERPDLILCDVSMPRLDGFGALEQIRKTEGIRNVPFIFLTAKAEKTDMRRGMELGANDYLTKPFTTDELINAVNAQFAKMQEIQKEIENVVDKRVFELGANISYALPHEFRTPLTGIISSTDMIGMVASDLKNGRNVDYTELENIAHDIRVSAERLRHLTENFLIFTQLQNIASRPNDVAALRQSMTEGGILGMVEDIFHMQANDLGRTEDLHINVEDSEIGMDSKDIYKIIQEIASNAFKFSKPGTPITVHGRIDGRVYHLSVNDKGCGIKEQDIPSLGIPFTQFDRTSNEQQGAGLGMAIVKKLLEIYDGSLTVQSILNQETTVIISVPTAPPMSERE
ncbi:MAG: response regulator [Bacteroidota bacterium]|nr:response regulator [Candidatus Kapabacteria bacterium]MDW8220107.1 response regulator [Bacteroidota bacterium]